MNETKKKSGYIQACSYDTTRIEHETIRQGLGENGQGISASNSVPGVQSAIDFWLFFY